MARVNVDTLALIDARFGVLAGLMGSDDSDLALGRMIRVWMQCIERETYVITKPVIVALFHGAIDAPEWLVRAELAEEVHGGLRIKGTQGRIEYLAEKRATARLNGTKGGRPRKPTSVTETNPRRGVVETPPAPAPAPALKEEPPLPPETGGNESDDTSAIDTDLWPEFVNAWVKAKLPGWDKGIQRTSTRVGFLQMRLASDTWRHQWRTAIERAGKSVRCRQGSGDWNGLQLDTFLRDPDILVRVIEGQFDDAQANGANKDKAGERKARIQAAIVRGTTHKVNPE